MDWKNKFPEYVMKTDDDIYINVPLLSRILFEETKTKEQTEKKPLLRGYIYITGPMPILVRTHP